MPFTSKYFFITAPPNEPDMGVANAIDQRYLFVLVHQNQHLLPTTFLLYVPNYLFYLNL